MKISRKAQLSAKLLYRSCLVDGRLDEGRVREVVRRVAEVKPRDYLPILMRFERLVRLELQRRQATVQGTVPLSPDFQASVQGNLSRRYGPGLNFVFGQDPGLVGGLRVQVGDDVYDGSVRARLETLKERF
jgi:F-type H+-transporting ATPase subunit delta